MTTDVMGRVLADASDPEAWHAARAGRIGASDAANFAKVESVPLYVRAKLRAREFRGNAYTATGNRWEEPALAGAGFARNTFLFASEHEEGFVATPDGIHIGDGGIVLAEAKAKLLSGRELAAFDPETWTPKIPPTHQRQMWWAQFVTGAVLTKYVVLPYDENHTPLLMVPRVIPFERDEQAIARLVTIATPVLRALRAAIEFERNLT